MMMKAKKNCDPAKMPTIADLLIRFRNVTRVTVLGYNNSSPINNNFDSHVIAYGIGFAGMVIIWKDKRKRAHAGIVTIKDYLITSNVAAGYKVLSPESALELIKSDDLMFAEAKISKDIDNLDKYILPQIGELKTKSNWDQHLTYTVEQYKNGNYRIQRVANHWHNSASLARILYLIDNKRDRYGEKLISNTIPEEHIKRMRQMVVAEKI